MKSEAVDVLVVGGGGAALRAAISAAEINPELNIRLVTKGELGSSGVTATACSDRMAYHATLDYTEPGGEDNWRAHADDVYRIGGEVSDYDLAEVLAMRSGESFEYLDELGVPFAKEPNGRATQFVTDGSEYARACFTGPHTANHIHQALLRRFREMNLPADEHSTIVRIAVSAAGECVGALGLDADGCPVAYAAKAVILATGGPGRIFETNVFPEGMTGAGHAAALLAGAELVNMEFIQLGLCSTATKLACSGSLMRCMPRLVGEQGEEFLADFFDAGTSRGEVYSTLWRKGASWPVSYEEPSHVIDIAVTRQARTGSVFIDHSANPQGFVAAELADFVKDFYSSRGADVAADPYALSPLERHKQINAPCLEWFKARGIDICAGGRIEIAPACQHFQGGIRIDTAGETGVKGLFACGECAGGQHGANRPGGHALMDSQVFGRICGESAAERSARTAATDMPPSAVDILEAEIKDVAGKGGLDPEEAFARLGRIMTRGCSVIRTRRGLEEAQARLVELKSEALAGGENATRALEFRAGLLAAEAILGSALAREESRGPHLRFESEESRQPLGRDDENWSRKYLVASLDSGGALRLDPRPVKSPESQAC
jgi:succinate dehydrogenase/fumarate reductase flavoprotein subunit